MNILGLDLGVGSIGWALIETDNDKRPVKIIGLGSRIVNLAQNEGSNFTKGKSETACAQRTQLRTARKNLDRYQLRRGQLKSFLSELGLIDPKNALNNLSPLELWSLRAKAATPGQQLSLTEIGRVLLHLNQRRGYRHAKADNSNSTKEATDYVASVNKRYAELHRLNLTVGQYMAQKLAESEITYPKGSKVYAYRIKGNVYPRVAYQEEFDKILETQSVFYPDILTSDNITKLRNIIFYQRPLKSCKHLVSTCEFQTYRFRNRSGQEIVTGPKVAPRTSPIAEVTRIYETINNLRLINPHNINTSQNAPSETNLPTHKSRLLQREYVFTIEERQQIFDFLNTHEKMTVTELYKLLGLKKSDGFRSDKALGKGIKGNSTYCAIAKALEGYDKYSPLLSFKLHITDSKTINSETGEILKEVSPDCIEQPLYRLWHTLYSISDQTELAKVLRDKFGITDEPIIERLCAIDFVTQGFSNRSAKFMRRLLPYLMEGEIYSDAAAHIGINHSSSLTNEENVARKLQKYLSSVKPNSLRQPTVEKILNQMVNLVNAIIDKYGSIDEIRVELARELKQSQKNRQERTKALGEQEKKNKAISALIEETGLKTTRSRIQKYRLWEESGRRCMYCGHFISEAEILETSVSERDHIIPRSIFFDDSYSNKVCSCSTCNKEKNNRTGYDYMESKGEECLHSYISRVDELFSTHKISRTKHDRLMTPGTKIPNDFLNRDLGLTQYISKKAVEILREVCHNVYTTTGAVTDFFRHIWGYDDILHGLNFKRYEKVGLIYEDSYEHEGQQHKRLRIRDWSKRLDHRHHAIDALTIALTRQGYIQRLNTLNTERDKMKDEITAEGAEFKRKHHLLEQWAASRPHFTVDVVTEAVSRIAVSFKPGKKVATSGKVRDHNGNIVQENVLIPRNALHQDTIYGYIKYPDSKEVTIKSAFETPGLIIDHIIRKTVEDLYNATNGMWKEAQKLLKKTPLLDPHTKKPIKKIKCYTEQYVTRYNVADMEPKDVDSIIDIAARGAVRRRYNECENNKKKFQQSLAVSPIYLDKACTRPIHKVRCLTGLSKDKIIAVRKDKEDKPIGYAMPGNNHHIAFYLTPDGKVDTRVISQWHAVKRKRFGLPVIVCNPATAWSIVAKLPDSSDTAELVVGLPDINSTFIGSLQRNEMYILGMSDEEWKDAMKSKDYATLTQHLYRVQKLSLREYILRHHLDTQAAVSEADKATDHYLSFNSYNTLKKANLRKVKITALGEIIPKK